jgi:ubiquitin carboxyl-terminal hydrolase MINDY-1/2
MYQSSLCPFDRAKSDRLKQSAPARLERSSDSIGGSSFTSDQDLALLRTFLDDSASQLTYHGLMELHEKLKEQELAVFFRNNHFSVITKHSGRLYLLVTDQGYLHQGQIVWERLDEVEGDTVLVDSDFVPFRSNQSELAPDFAAEAQSGFALLAPADQGGEDPSLALARKMQEEYVTCT